MKLKTRVLEPCKEKYRSLYELALVTGISLGYIYNVRQGKQSMSSPLSKIVTPFYTHYYSQFTMVE